VLRPLLLHQQQGVDPLQLALDLGPLDILVELLTVPGVP
jgi:hypothetical protein